MMSSNLYINGIILANLLVQLCDLEAPLVFEKTKLIWLPNRNLKLFLISQQPFKKGSSVKNMNSFNIT